MPRISLEHPRTVLVRLLAGYSKRKYSGKLPDPVAVMLHNKRVLTSVLAGELGATRWKSLSPTIQCLAVMGASVAIGCSWCVDFGYWAAHHEGVDPRKIEQVPNWRESELYTDAERRVLEYSAAMTATPPTVTDEMVAGLRRDFSAEQLVELTALIALENQRSRFNAAFGLSSQGFKDTCAVKPA